MALYASRVGAGGGQVCGDLAQDLARLTAAFERLAAHAPDGYADWSELAQSGVAAARAKDATQVSQVCKRCHHAHRGRFRKERRSQPLF